MNNNKNMLENIPQKCPICGKEIYITNNNTDYACIDINCKLGKGFLKTLEEINIKKCYNFYKL